MLWTEVQLADMVCSFSEAWVICEARLLLSLSAPGQLLCVFLTLFARREHDSLLWCLALVVMFLLSCGYLSLDFLGIILSIVSGIVISNDKNKTRPGESLLWAFWKWRKWGAGEVKWFMQGHTSSSWSADSPAESLFSQMGDRQRDLESEEGCLFYGAHQKFQMVRL